MMETKKRQESLLSHLFDLALMQLNPIWGFDQMAIIGGIEAGGTKFICIMYDTVNESILCGTVVKTTTGGYRYYAFTSSGTITFN